MPNSVYPCTCQQWTIRNLHARLKGNLAYSRLIAAARLRRAMIRSQSRAPSYGHQAPAVCGHGGSANRESADSCCWPSTRASLRTAPAVECAPTAARDRKNARLAHRAAGRHRESVRRAASSADSLSARRLPSLGLPSIGCQVLESGHHGCDAVRGGFRALDVDDVVVHVADHDIGRLGASGVGVMAGAAL
jgi:hypothetical protein